MPTDAPSKNVLVSGARGAGTAVLILGLFIYMLGTPPLAYGIWFQTEPVTVGLLVLGAAAGLCLLALDLTGHPIALLLGRRHIQVLLLFLAWNAVVSATQAFPGRGWFGTPETGEGILTFLALLMLTLLAMALWPHRKPRLALVAAAIISALVLGGMDSLLPWESAWRPEKYAGYAGTVGPPVMLIVASAFRRIGWKALLAAVLVGLAPVAFSGNKTAVALMCLGGPAVYAFASWVRRRLPLRRARTGLAWLPIAAFLLTCATVAGAVAYGEFDPLYSVWSRGLLILAGLTGIAGQPLALLTGFGWGAFNDLLYQHTFLPGVHGFANGVWDPNWEGVGAGAFHVHNDIIEAVLGGGLIGGALYATFYPAVIAGARRGMLVIGAVGWFLTAGSLCFWYPFMLSYPFLATAIAATTVPLGGLRASTAFPLRGWVRAAGLGLVALLGAGAAMSFQDARAGGDRLAALNRQDPADIPAFGTFPPDHDRGGIHLWWLALNEAAAVGGALSADRPMTPSQAQWYGRLLDEVDSWTDRGHAGVRLEALSLVLRNNLAAGPDSAELTALRARAFPGWEPALLRVIRRAPDRTDVAVPFLSFLALTKQYSRTVAVCDRIVALHPNDRVCLWYSGIAMLTDQATISRGLGAMHRALALGVEAVAPVTKAVRDTVEANVPVGQR